MSCPDRTRTLLLLTPLLLLTGATAYAQSAPTTLTPYFSLGDSIVWRYVHERYFPGETCQATYESTYSLQIDSVDGDTAYALLDVAGDIEPFVTLSMDGVYKTRGLDSSGTIHRYGVQYRVKLNRYTSELYSADADRVSERWRYIDSVQGRTTRDSVSMFHQKMDLRGIWKQLCAQPLDGLVPDSTDRGLRYEYTRGEQRGGIDHMTLVTPEDSPLPTYFSFESDPFGLPGSRRVVIQRYPLLVSAQTQSAQPILEHADTITILYEVSTNDGAGDSKTQSQTIILIADEVSTEQVRGRIIAIGAPPGSISTINLADGTIVEEDMQKKGVADSTEYMIELDNISGAIQSVTALSVPRSLRDFHKANPNPPTDSVLRRLAAQVMKSTLEQVIYPRPPMRRLLADSIFETVDTMIAKRGRYTSDGRSSGGGEVERTLLVQQWTRLSSLGEEGHRTRLLVQAARTTLDRTEITSSYERILEYDNGDATGIPILNEVRTLGSNGLPGQTTRITTSHGLKRD